MLVSLQKRVRSPIVSLTPAIFHHTPSAYPRLGHPRRFDHRKRSPIPAPEKGSKGLAAFIKSTLGPTSADPSVYHDADPPRSIDALLARSDINAVIDILPITEQPEVVLKALAADKCILSSYENMFRSIGREVSFSEWQKIPNTSLSIERRVNSSAVVR